MASAAANATMKKFGHPATLVAETSHWVVLARPGQVTLGSLVLVCSEPATAFGQVSPAAFADLQGTVGRIEKMLKGFVDYSKINYLMLMMVDPDVHFHVLPRYEGAREFQGQSFPDSAWPGPPLLSQAVTLEPSALTSLAEELKHRWPRTV